MVNALCARDILLHPQSGDESDIREACRVAIDALEKQIPKKPIPKTYPYMEKGYQYRNTCPSCNENLTKILIYNETANPNHCPNCGQALDWGD